MSWLFGIKSPPPTASDILGVDINQPVGAAGGGDGGGKEPPKDSKKAGSGGIESSYRFDSSALERAAQAAKDLEKSSHAKDVSTNC